MTRAAEDEFCRGVAALLRRVHPDGATLELDDALAEFAAALAVVDDPDSHDPGDRSQGSLTRADALRIRASKFVAAQLPPGLFADPTLRRTIAAAIRELTAAAVGGLAASRYLDPPARAD